MFGRALNAPLHTAHKHIKLLVIKIDHVLESHVIQTACGSSHRMCSIEKAVFKISQYSQENTCLGVSF